MTCMHLNHISLFDHRPLRLGLLSDRPCRALTTMGPAPAIVTSGSTPAIHMLARDSLGPSLVSATAFLPPAGAQAVATAEAAIQIPKFPSPGKIGCWGDTTRWVSATGVVQRP